MTTINTETITTSPTLDELTALYRSNGFEVFDSLTWPDCAGDPWFNIIRFEGDDEEGPRAAELAKANGYGFWLRELQHIRSYDDDGEPSSPYWHLTFHIGSINRQG